MHEHSFVACWQKRRGSLPLVAVDEWRNVARKIVVIVIKYTNARYET